MWVVGNVVAGGRCDVNADEGALVALCLETAFDLGPHFCFAPESSCAASSWAVRLTFC